MSKDSLPLVYSCSGCSNVAQLANEIALKLDQQNLAEMSCIAGIGGGVKAILKKAQNNRKKLVIDGCPLHCAKSCMQNQNLPFDEHIDLSTLNYKKRKKQLPSSDDIELAYAYTKDFIKQKFWE